MNRKDTTEGRPADKTEPIAPGLPPWAGWVAFAFAVGWFWSFHTFQISLSDEGLLIDSALRIMRGEMVGRDFPDVWSFAQYLVALAMSVFGKDLLVARRLMVLLKSTTALLTLLCGVRLATRPWAIGAYLSVLLLSGPLFKAFTPLALVLFLYAALTCLESPGRWTACRAGCCIGAAVLLRPVLSILVVCLLLGYLSVRGTGRAGGNRGSGSALAPVLLCAILTVGLGLVAAASVARPLDGLATRSWQTYLTAQGWNDLSRSRLAGDGPNDVYSIVALFVHDALLNTRGGSLGAPARSMRGLQPAEPFPSLVFSLLELMALMTPVLLVLAVARRQTRELELLLVIGIASTIKYFSRADVSHLLQHVPVLSVMLVALAHQFAAPGSDKLLTSSGYRLRRALAASAGFLLLAALAGVSIQVSDLYTGGVGVARTEAVPLKVPVARVLLEESQAAELEDVTDILSNELKSGQTFLALPYCSMLYFLAQKPSPAALSFEYGYLNEQELSGAPGSRLDIIRKLLRAREVDMVILDKHYQPGMEGVPAEERFPVLLEGILADFEWSDETNRFILYRYSRWPETT